MNKKEEPIIRGTINLKVEQVAEHTMYLTQQFGKGSLGKTEFNAVFTLPGMSLIVEVDHVRYMVSSQEIISEIIRLIEQK